jgi:hypothetical protein
MKTINMTGEVYQLTDNQLVIVNQASEQARNGQFLTEEQANKEIDEWFASNNRLLKTSKRKSKQ